MNIERSRHMENTTYRLVTSADGIREYLRGAPEVAVDFETSPKEEYRDIPRASLDPAMNIPTGISFCTRIGTGIYVPINHIIGKNIDPMELHELLFVFFRDTRMVKIVHNLAFEAAIAFTHYGAVIQEPVYDTLAAAQMSNDGDWMFRKLKDSGLKTLARDVLGTKLPTFTDVTSGRHFDELDPADPETIRYGCADSDFALRLYHLYNGWFDKWLPPHRWIVEHVESPVSIYSGIMRCHGVPVDQDYLTRKRTEARIRMTEVQSRIEAATGGIKIGKNCSTKAFKDYLFRTLNLPIMKVTDKGAESVDDQAMQMLTEWSVANRPELADLFRQVQEYRSLGKTISTYLDGYLKYVNPVTGRIHPDFFSLSTDTGRMSCSKPNLQNMPRKANDPVGIRDAIRAPEGHLILSLDFSQIELRVGAYYCRDQRMIDTYRANGDIHAQTTAIIFGISYDEAANKDADGYKECRSIAKNVNFGVFYGLYPKGLQDTLKYKAGIDRSEEECRQIIYNLKAGYPGLAMWQQRAKMESWETCRAWTLAGRTRYLPDIRSADWGRKSFAERCALNTPIQGTAADILKMAMVRILAGLQERPWLQPILQIHDELVFIIPDDRLDEAVMYVKACMEVQPFQGFDVPLIAEAAAGRTFGQMKELNDDGK